MSSVNYEFVDGLAVLTIRHDRAPVLGTEIMSEIGTHVAKARSDGVRALLLRADGRVFAAGADVSTFKGMREDEARAMFTGYMSVVHEIEDLDVPTVAAVQGMCLGGGLEIALACDVIVAQEGTMFGQVEALVGAVTFLGGVYRLAERCGTARALEITYTGALYPADTFRSWGIVSRVVEANDFAAEAMALAASLAHGPTAAHRVTKQVLRKARVDGLRGADELILQISPALLETSDLQTGVDMMLTKGSRAFMAEGTSVAFRGQ
jgi:enoyl-CoA hydratase/carnithine racemase